MTRVLSKQLSRWCVPVLVCTILFLPLLASAQYVSLVGIKGMEQIQSGGADDFIETLYRIAIVGAALVAVIKLILAGAKYVMSGIVTDKEDAKRDIRSALVGLLIIIAAVTILTTINPNISNLKPLEPIIVPDPFKGREAQPDQDTVEYWCKEYGKDNCSTLSCNVLESGLWNWVAWGGADNINSAICSGRCLYFGGQIVEDGKTCVYPTDSETYREKRAEAETAEIDADLDQELDDGVHARECSTQGGPTQCQREEEACTSGNLLPSGERGIASNTVTNSGNRVVICTPLAE